MSHASISTFHTATVLTGSLTSNSLSIEPPSISAQGLERERGLARLVFGAHHEVVTAAEQPVDALWRGLRVGRDQRLERGP